MLELGVAFSETYYKDTKRGVIGAVAGVNPVAETESARLFFFFCLKLGT
jgi:hypothetical protein